MYKGNARWDVTVLTETYEELSGDLRVLNTLQSFQVLKCISKSSSFTRQKEMSRKKKKSKAIIVDHRPQKKAFTATWKTSQRTRPDWCT